MEDQENTGLREQLESLMEDRNRIIEAINQQADVFRDGIEINQKTVDEIVQEINMIWSVLELPWYKRLRRLGRSWAVSRLDKAL